MGYNLLAEQSQSTTVRCIWKKHANSQMPFLLTIQKSLQLDHQQEQWPSLLLHQPPCYVSVSTQEQVRKLQEGLNKQ
uniref:Uncharacterized protein n=1 Tax=Rhizophora mucronata TaxID=61149 RepID=A0A2P2KA77_RHIMU